MSVYVGNDESIQEYFNKEALNSGTLKLLSKGLDHYKSNKEKREDLLFYEEKRHFVIGGAVDTILTGNDYKEKYYVSELDNKPSDTIMSIIQEVYTKAKELNEHILDFNKYTSLILESCDNHEYSSNWKADTRVNKILEHYSYWESLIESDGKQVISKEEDNIISSIIMSLTTKSSTKHYFDRRLYSEGNVDIYYQKAIYFKVFGIDCKALIDILIIEKDDNNKIKDIQVIDLKTIGDSVLSFPKSVSKFRYDIQACWYLLATYCFVNNTEIKKDFNISEDINYFLLDSFKFVVESTVESYIGNPSIFNISPDYIVKTFNDVKGLKTIVNGGEVVLTYPKKGIKSILKDYQFYLNNSFDKDILFVENNNNFFINNEGLINMRCEKFEYKD